MGSLPPARSLLLQTGAPSFGDGHPMHSTLPALPGQPTLVTERGTLISVSPEVYEDAQFSPDEQTLLRHGASAPSPVSASRSGWLLDYDAGSSRFLVFLFCIARRVHIPPAFISRLLTSQLYAMSLGDYLDATTWHEWYTTPDHPGIEHVLHVVDLHVLRESLQILPMESLRLRLAAQSQCVQQQAQLVCRYRDSLRLLADAQWRLHTFVPEQSVLPPYLREHFQMPQVRGAQ